MPTTRRKFEVLVHSLEEIPPTLIISSIQAYTQISLEQHYEDIKKEVSSSNIVIKVKEIEEK